MDEKQRTFRGDMLIQKLTSGHLQAIEADRIRNPDTRKYRGNWKNGTLMNRAGRITHYAVHRRTDHGGYEFERIMKANRVYHYGYYMRHDQRRGVSQMASAINHLRQAHNAIRYAQAKQVISQIFGMKVKKNSPKSKDINLANGPFIAEMHIDEDMDIMADNTPSKEFDSFLRHVISIIMKSLDLPYNFYDESHTNFFGSRAALNLYLMSCLAKRRGVRELLNHLTLWRLNFEVSRGRLTLPRGVDLATFYRKHCEWIPIGVQWWNPKQEADAAEKLIKLRLATRGEIRKQTHGDSWYSMMDRYDREDIRLANEMAQGIDDEANENEFTVDSIVDGVVERLAEMGIAA
jgi:capsid protein